MNQIEQTLNNANTVDDVEKLERSLKPQGFTQRIFPIAWSLVLGLATGVFAHYLLYRLSLPTEPFIYAAF
ncbi:MAG TPA: hypothetical protein V6C97_32205 [Oculatellaceae cyanobacterium]